MRMRRLGQSGPEISVLGFGAWEFGGRVDRPERPETKCLEALMSAFEAGVTWVDTAETYGAGRSERIVGTARSQFPGDVIIASKLAPIPSSSGSGFEPWQIRWGLERILTRLKMDCLDILMLHWPDPRTDLRKTWSTMADLVEERRVRFIGLSNFPQDLIELCHDIRQVDCAELRFSLLDRGRTEEIAWCGANGIGVITYGSLAYGILTGKRRASPRDEGSDFYQDLFDERRLRENLKVVDALEPLAREFECSVGQLALAWVIHQTGVVASLFGSTNPKHVRENGESAALELDGNVMTRIEAAVANSMFRAS